MKIYATQFTLYDNSFEIYVSGCNQHCSEECHNKQLWSFDIGEEYDQKYFNKIRSKVDKFGFLIDRISIFGGEPLDQPDIIVLLIDLVKLKKQIWLYTSYDFDKVPADVKSLCDYIKCGKYIPSLKCDDKISFGVKLSSKNQEIYKLWSQE